MNMESSPNLIEPGAKYFIHQTLKNCNKTRSKYYNNLTNLGLFLGFIIIFGGVLYYKYNTRPNEKIRKKKEKLKQTYILSKIRALIDKSAQENNKIITDLPRFESDFEILHKNFFKT